MRNSTVLDGRATLTSSRFLRAALILSARVSAFVALSVSLTSSIKAPVIAFRGRRSSIPREERLTLFLAVLRTCAYAPGSAQVIATVAVVGSLIFDALADSRTFGPL